MKAAFFYKPGHITVEDVEIPQIKENEMLMHVRSAAICGTDLRIFKNGHFKIPPGVKRVLGHETAGEIVKVGKLVEGFKEGTRCTVTPNIGCGFCGFCRGGYNNMCADYEAFGISIDGGFQEFMHIPNIAIRGGNVFPIPDHIEFDEATLIEPLSCCYNSLKSLKTSHEDIVLVIGAGPVGALHVLLNRIAGAKKVISADIRKERLEMIVSYGADYIIDASQKDLKEEVMNYTKGKGADVIIVAASSPELQTRSIELLATHGRINFFGGLGKNEQVFIDTNRIHYKGLHILGTTGSTNSDYFKSLKLVDEGRADLKRLISKSFQLDEINEAFEYTASGKGLKNVINN